MADREDQYELTQEDFEQQLEDQLQFLENSAKVYDDGFESEAKRLAVTLRVLLHDTRSSTSVLTHLGIKNQPFLDTALKDPHSETPVLKSYSGLVAAYSGPEGARFIPHLDTTASTSRLVDFETWWTQPVIIDTESRKLSRADLIRTAADQDGGKHVDARLNRAYAEISRKNSLQWFSGRSEEFSPLRGAEGASIRQIAHEVLKTLRPNYTKATTHETGFAVSGFEIVFSPCIPDSASRIIPQEMRRNECCYCGSGLRYKHCHGRTS
ncbi:SEC-C domain-containing protein [Microvirga aerophila]|uniref:SEC-C domain-containing protein n=1 Tax=Microvirga aerophila TaxID=670291 RepID=UPI0011BD6B79|nr:SEC-C domain-containing protein [Microvirga aerophila]